MQQSRNYSYHFQPRYAFGYVMKKYLYLMYFLSLNIFATGHLSNIKPGVTLYSEYYPNTTTKFKGTIIFENGIANA